MLGVAVPRGEGGAEGHGDGYAHRERFGREFKGEGEIHRGPKKGRGAAAATGGRAAAPSQEARYWRRSVVIDPSEAHDVTGGEAASSAGLHALDRTGLVAASRTAAQSRASRAHCLHNNCPLRQNSKSVPFPHFLILALSLVRKIKQNKACVPSPLG